MGVEVQELTPDNPEALALLAWHELVEIAQKSLPLLVVAGQVFEGQAIGAYLKGIMDHG